MSKDIFEVLSGWPFDPDGTSVRIVKGDDGREKIQLRLDLGLLQMNFNGRPDGLKPEGQESWLEHYKHRQAEHDAANPDSTPFVLEPDDCALLLREGIQYYHRYLSFWHMRRFELCARDTRRNLQLFAFVREHARRDQDRLQFDQWRPYVTMMHTKAVATPLVELRQYDSARQVIEAGIQEIEKFLSEYEQTDRALQCFELLHLQRWLKEIESRQNKSGRATPNDLPAGETTSSEMTSTESMSSTTSSSAPDQLAQLRVELDQAIADERFEDAARLRDQISGFRAGQGSE